MPRGERGGRPARGCKQTAMRTSIRRAGRLPTGDGRSLGPVHDDVFYSTAAQVIPVLALALMFELRFFDQRDESISWSLWLLSFLIALVGGEALALGTLLEDDAPSTYTQLMVSAAMAWGGLGLFLPLFSHRFERLGDALPEPLVRGARIASLPALGAVIALAYAFPDADVIPGAVATLWVITAMAAFATGGRVPDGVPNEGDSGETEDN
jgi:hypothetical protein